MAPLQQSVLLPVTANLDSLSLSPVALAKLVMRTGDLDSIVGMGANTTGHSVCMLAVQRELV